ncbi:agmatine/peptidylarginine deiminase [Candidatus Nitrosacidococcus sp. I8]|uniref:agmatine deiminase family protein n=1 Tax=Candidatus Nitrosacidococcus sp. I8 TaxID=2942908 RepID=UPI0022269B88|nr:agmatine deiminase family protein [Candidatus Nitrosacidococcus sp. I8]CAH9019027.1 Putative agmatine deiminase [Candidatus Nitrosacidococcus sp. I8]
MDKSQYTFAPEWIFQAGVMLAWPHLQSPWQPYFDSVQGVYINIAREISSREKLLIICNSVDQRVEITHLFVQEKINLENCFFYDTSFNDTWIRDYGPISCIDEEGKIKLLDFTFNGWGKKHKSELDNQVTQCLYQQHTFNRNITYQSLDFILEGGSIETDGQGSLLTTEHCLLSKARNSFLNKEEITQKLKNWLGVERVLWLNHGQLIGDDTDGHIDTLARFCNPETICYVACDDSQDSHFEDLKAMEEELKTLHTLQGNPYQLVPLPWPSPKISKNGQRLPASYANFLIINQAVLVPTYEDKADEQVLSTLQMCFPDREIIGINCLTLIQQYGSLHCITMQLPFGSF